MMMMMMMHLVLLDPGSRYYSIVLSAKAKWAGAGG